MFGLPSRSLTLFLNGLGVRTSCTIEHEEGWPSWTQWGNSTHDLHRLIACGTAKRGGFVSDGIHIPQLIIRRSFAIPGFYLVT